MVITLLLGHSFTCCATFNVYIQPHYASWPKELYNFCVTLYMGWNSHSLTESPLAHSTSILSPQVWTTWISWWQLTPMVISGFRREADEEFVAWTPQWTHYLLTGSDSLPAATAQYLHVAITLRSRQLLKMGTWLTETCWATCKGEIKDKTKVTSRWFLIHIFHEISHY